jgi:hypothetical protein
VTTDTVLTLSGPGIAPFSARGLSENLKPLDAGQLRRTVNGTLTDLTLTAFRKFRVTISAQDVMPPALDGIWKGQEITVGCTSSLGAKVTLTAGSGTVALSRKPVTGSGRAIWRSGDTVKETTSVTFSETSGVWSAAVNFGDAGLSGAAYVYFRPELLCMVTETDNDHDEYAARPGWSITLEEK